MVSRRHVQVGIVLQDHAGQVFELKRSFNLITPPVPLCSVSASCLHDGLYCHSSVKDIVECERQLLYPAFAPCPGNVTRHEHWRMFAPESDAASGNDRMIAHHMLTSERRRESCGWWLDCRMIT